MTTPEQPPRPEADVASIDRGIDIRLRGVQEIRNRALALHRRYVALASTTQAAMSTELAKSLDEQDLAKVERLHAELARIEDAILGLDRILGESFEQEHALREERVRLVERLTETDIGEMSP